MAGDPARARQLLESADEGVAKFVTHFGRVPGRFAVIEVDDGKISSAAAEALRQGGFTTVLPWLSNKGYQAQTEQSVRKAIDAQAGNLPADVREGLVKQALAQLNAQPRDSGQELGALAHELGHQWYSKAFWPAKGRGAGHYGGEGPDWMDETAAVLMETDALAEERIAEFAERYKVIKQNPGAGPVDKLIDLSGFFNSPHPGALLAEQMLAELRKKDSAADPEGGVSVRAVSGPEADKFAEKTIHYYLTATMVGRYLTERSGNPAIFGSIGQAFARGETMEQWLASAPAGDSLPSDLEGLQADWLLWLDRRFGM